MTFCFRTRFVLGRTVKLRSDSSEIVLSEPSHPSERVTLRALGQGVTLEEARQLVLLGKGYEGEGAALQAADGWRSALQAAFARCNLGADFGGRAATGSFTVEGLKMFAGESGLRVLNDVHGTDVFACDPRPSFLSISTPEVMIGKDTERLSRAIRSARQLGVSLSGQEQLAFDLYSASFSEASEDARFVMLMMAVETLLDPQDRTAQTVAHVDALVHVTEGSSLPRSEIESIVGSLNYMRKESIGQAGRRLAGTLGTRRYLDGKETARQFFTRCYQLRSKLVHGYFPRPTREEVGVRAASLELFVSHLLSGQLLDEISD